MILCFQCEDLSKIFLVSKFEMNRPNIKLIIAFCAIWHLGSVLSKLIFQLGNLYVSQKIDRDF